MRNKRLLSILCFALGACAGHDGADLVSYVDPRIGSGGHGHVFVGASVPFGMVQLGPTSIPQSWDWTSGYHASDSTVIGFSHTHLNGTGIGDLFDITVMPVTGEVTYARGSEDDPGSGLWSYADRSKEITEPGYYSVPLTRYGIRAELTASERVGMHRYTFPSGEDAAIVFDLQDGGCWDKAKDTGFTIIDSVTVSGWRHSKGWAKRQKQYFYAVFSKPFTASVTEDGRFGRFSFKTAEGEKVLLKVALSAVSEQGAAAAMAAEVPGWDFDALRSAARGLWNEALSKIRVKTSDEQARKIFYTALYHTMVAPSLFCDIDGSYRGADGEVHGSDACTYTTFSLWDTYRAAMPLYYIIHPERRSDIIDTMLRIYDEQGKLPVWHLVGNETDCMVGNPGVIVVADAIVKDIPGFDKQRAYEACKASVMLDERGQDLRKRYGYIPCDLYAEACANDMEYAIADAAVARAAKALGLEQDARFFEERSHSWRNFFDRETLFVRGRTASGGWRTPFNPFFSPHRANDYCEGNAWQYTWLAPHDLGGLIEGFGSRDAMLERLDSLFRAPQDMDEDVSPDMSGFIGQYVHGNEPSHHIVYFYTMAGQPWKTADRVREILAGQYGTGWDGLAGNEDVGQMSAWYILSSIGFYQSEPASERFYLGTPLFERVEMNVGEGRVFTVEAPGTSDSNRYIQSVRINGRPCLRPYITWSEIEEGATLTLEMGPEPAIWYCVEYFLSDAPYPQRRPSVQERCFSSPAVEKTIEKVAAQLSNPKLRQMFINCFPNTLDTTVHPVDDGGGEPDTYVFTGDIPAMWLRDSGAQVWPYVQLIGEDPALGRMIAGVIRRQFKCINIDPYANAFNVEPIGAANKTDVPEADPYVFERKWEIDSHCYPIRLAYAYWKQTGDTSVFDGQWLSAMRKIIDVMREQQRREGHGCYTFLRTTDRQLDTKCVVGRGNPVRPCGLIASAFRPSDDATTFEYLVPSNFMAVSSLRKASEILSSVCGESGMAGECDALADEVQQALREHAVVEHPVFGRVYAFEVDGFGSRFLMDDANVPSLLSMAYLDPEMALDPVYQNTRRMVWSGYNPYFFRGRAGEGIGGPHIGVEHIWQMSIMMKAFTATDDDEIQACIMQLLRTDAGTGFIHESFHKDDASDFTREWFAWQNTLFGELILKLINDGKVDLLNNII